MNQKKSDCHWELAEEWIKIAWEFKRDNKDLRKDYKKILKYRRESKYSPAYRIENKEKRIVEYPYFKTVEGQKEWKLCNKWQVGFPFPNPYRSYYQLCGINSSAVPEASGTNVTDEQNFMRYHISTRLFGGKLRGGVFLASDILDYQRKNSKIRIEIDFEKINSIAQLKKCISRLIDNYLFWNKEIAKRQRYKKDFDIILKVGRLKKKNPHWSDEAIAAEIWPEQFNENPDSKTRWVNQLINEYRALVNGEYKDILFP